MPPSSGIFLPYFWSTLQVSSYSTRIEYICNANKESLGISGQMVERHEIRKTKGGPLELLPAIDAMSRSSKM